MLPARSRPINSIIDRFDPLSAILPNLDDAGLKSCTIETIEEAFSQIKVQLEVVDLTNAILDSRGAYTLTVLRSFEERKLEYNIYRITEMCRNWIMEGNKFIGLASTHTGQMHHTSDIVIAKTQCMMDQLAKIETECAGKRDFIRYMVHVRESLQGNAVRNARDDHPRFQNFLQVTPVIEFYENCGELLALADDWQKEITILHKHLNLRRSTRIKKPVTKYQAGGTK